MKLIPVAAAVLAAALTLPTASAAPVSTPPAPVGPTTSEIFDAMLAIARAASTNPAAAQAATFSYQAAIQQYNIGDHARARQSAIAAIGQAMTVPLPTPSIAPPAIPQPVYHPMPLLVTANQADAEGYLALARRSMSNCGVAGTNPAQTQPHYAAASAALEAKKYDVTRTQSMAIIDYCAQAAQALATQAVTSPQPSAAPATPRP